MNIAFNWPGTAPWELTAILEEMLPYIVKLKSWGNSPGCEKTYKEKERPQGELGHHGYFKSLNYVIV